MFLFFFWGGDGSDSHDSGWELGYRRILKM